MLDKCPGQSSRFIKASYVKCKCGYEVEIFSNELKVKCAKCGSFVYRKKMPSCVEWCKAARDCVGYQKWKELQETKDNKKGSSTS